MTTYEFVISTTFPNGYNMDILSSQIIEDTLITSELNSISVKPTNTTILQIIFKDPLSSDEYNELVRLCSVHVPPRDPDRYVESGPTGGIIVKAGTNSLKMSSTNDIVLSSTNDLHVITGNVDVNCSGNAVFNTTGSIEWNAGNLFVPMTVINHQNSHTVIPDTDFYQLSSSDLLNKIIVCEPSSLCSLYLPSDNDIISCGITFQNNHSIDFSIINTSLTGTITIGSIIGNSIIQANSSGMFRLRIMNDSTGAYIVFRLC